MLSVFYNQKTATRDTRIDILRAIALICIIIAHSTPNSILSQIRNFDVILMTLLMGASFAISSNRGKSSYCLYMKKRFQRLIIPSWIFLTIFFVLFWIISLFKGDSFYFTKRDVIGSYALIDGIGYIWIIRVFFVIALINPVLLLLSKKIKSNIIYLSIYLSILLCYTILMKFGNYMHLHGTMQRFYSDLFLSSIAYSIISAIGIRLSNLKQLEILLLIIICGICLYVLANHYQFSCTQNFKYPPRLYYIAYGLFVSLLLYWLFGFYRIRFFFEYKIYKIIVFLSRTSIWFYFWHIIFIYIIKLFLSDLEVFKNCFYIRFGFIFLFALLTTYLHEFFKNKFYSYKS
jgi:peptidoglycan/LPS O-acetylase OafA/YrhL